LREGSLRDDDVVNRTYEAYRMRYYDIITNPKMVNLSA